MSEQRDISKLPKWAQAELLRLESDVDYWKARATEGPEDSDTFIHSYLDPTPIGKGPIVRFQLTGDDQFRDAIQVRRDGDAIYVSGGDTLQVEPRASNVVKVRNVRL